MKKKGILFRVGVVSAALTLATTSLMSGTLAKYNDSVTSKAEAIVAYWGAEASRFTYGGTKTALTNEVSIPLGGYITSATNGLDKIAGETANNYYIAPGVSGKVPLTIDMTGAQVATDFSIDIYNASGVQWPDGLNITAKATIAGTAGETITKTGTEIKTTSATTEGGGDGPVNVAVGTIPNKDKVASGKTQTAVVELSFEWPYENATDVDVGDAADTLRGNAELSGRQPMLGIVMTATQHDPGQTIS